jgi:hypothetical protein
MSLGAFVLASMVTTFEAAALGHPRQAGAAAFASCVAGVAFVLALRTRSQAASEGTDPAAQRLAALAMAAAGLGFALSLAPIVFPDHRPRRAEAEVSGETHSMIAHPEKCRLAIAFEKHGHRITRVTGSSEFVA